MVATEEPVKLTSVFSKNIDAYTNRASDKIQNLIVNQGGTRSSKSYSILQLLYFIATWSKKPLIISVVSRSLPHLKVGAMRDFDNILLSMGVIPDSIKNKSGSFYKVGESIIEFWGVDNLGKVHGPARDILFINECNYIKEEIYDQLAVRTKGAIFLDFNPSRRFWYHESISGKVPHQLIKSTYLDNEFLTYAQIQRIEAKKANEHWWRVYGLGELGRLEGAIFKNWRIAEGDEWFNSIYLPYGYGLDFGVLDPDAMVRVAIDKKNKKIYIKEELYETGNGTDELVKHVKPAVGKRLVIADSAGARHILDLRKAGVNIIGCGRKDIVGGIKILLDYELIIHPESYNLIRELEMYEWADKTGEIPIDDFNHLIDALRYYTYKMLWSSNLKIKKS
jgi:phage terminase large subunit